MPICIHSVSFAGESDATPLPQSDPYVIYLGDVVRRLFLIWNRGYKVMPIVAVDSAEALQLAVMHKHIKRAAYYRRFDDFTDAGLAGDSIDSLGRIEGLEALLNAGRSGRLCLNDEGVWEVRTI